MQIRTLLASAATVAVLAGCASGGTQTQTGTADSSAGMSSTTTTYEGTLPCRSCDGIDLTVDLSGTESSPAAERTFTLEADYRNHPQNPGPEQYRGNWEVISGTPYNAQAKVYELTPDGEGQVYYFDKLNSTTLELIDPQLRRFENGKSLRLYLAGGQGFKGAIESAMNEAYNSYSQEADATLISQAQASLKYNLKDPESAQFRDMEINRGQSDGKKQLYTCGEMNAKNSYGGYNGFKPFIAIPGGQVLISDEDLPELNEIISDFCN
ncbi:copper resistance protein NlpE N-terminal domain-containing protein [Salinicola sp. 4072]|uniref:copper resistance protein NlpE N-terminal domain-containing protein n=1 Tax=Salinicola sp. 4072 TaxID=3082157 RepID=UPI002FC73C93